MMADAAHIQSYLNARQEDRLQYLQEFLLHRRYLPLDLVKRLFAVGVPEAEKQLLVQLLAPDFSGETEKTYLEILSTENQNIGAISIEQWAKHTAHQRWKDVLDLSKKDLPQRIKYKLLEHSEATCIQHTVRHLLLDPNLQDLSPALHGLLCKKSLHSHFYSEEMEKIATDYFDFLSKESFSPRYEEIVAKALPDLLLWWMRFSPGKVRILASIETLPEWMQSFAYNLFLRRELEKELLLQLEEGVKRKDPVFTVSYLRILWPPIWLRHQISVELVTYFLLGCTTLVRLEEPETFTGHSLFWGIPAETLEFALQGMSQSETYLKSLSLVQSLLCFPISLRIRERLQQIPFDLKLQYTRVLDARFELPQPYFPVRKKQDVERGPVSFVLQAEWIQALAKHPDPATAISILKVYTKETEPWFLECIVQTLLQLKIPSAGEALLQLLLHPSLSHSRKIHVIQQLKNFSLDSLWPSIRRISEEMAFDEPPSVEIRELQENLWRLFPIESSIAYGFSSSLAAGENAYRSVELSLKEHFFPHIERLLTSNLLQRKLDIAGYFRQVERKMQVFETYLMTLPVICEIPSLRPQQIRNLLRQLCDTIVATEFSLQEVQAYGVFFLCFSRKTCNFGFEHSFPLGFIGEEDLFAFCRELLLFQEFRRQSWQGRSVRVSQEELADKTERLLEQIQQAATGV